MFPQVAFPIFGTQQNQFVAPSLKQLAGAMEKVVAAFMAVKDVGLPSVMG